MGWEKQMKNQMKNHLALMRKHRGYTLQQLSDRADVGKSTIWELEDGTGPMLITAYKIIDALDCDIRCIWPGDDIAKPSTTKIPT